MQLLVDLVLRYGLGLAFAAVLVEQIGLPVPSYPVLVVAAALAARGNYSVVHVVALAVIACVLADVGWYRAGARFGRRVLTLVCRISLSPDSCVRQTENLYEQWGTRSLLVAKFIPGFATVSTAMAGVVGVSLLTFLLFDIIGATLWAGLAVLLGWTFRDAVDDILRVVQAAGQIGLVAIAFAFALYLLIKFVQRHRLLQQLKTGQVSVDELHAMLKAEPPPLVIDVRSHGSRESGIIPGSRWIEPRAPDEALRSLPVTEEVVVYCACPSEASAATVARRLLKAGFRRVRPLQGGIEAWIASGLPLEVPAPR
jgi:membrane protein DedA with SNARE-associated domain/rhodanese-related sulfurtransferase